MTDMTKTSRTPTESAAADQIDEMLTAHGLRRTAAVRAVMDWMLKNPEKGWSHAQLSSALLKSTALPVDRVTLYRLLDRLAQAGLLVCTVDSERVRHYRAAPEVAAPTDHLPRFECQACHRNFELEGAGPQFEKAAKSALKALEAIGHLGLSVDMSVRGVCVDCGPGGAASP